MLFFKVMILFIISLTTLSFLNKGFVYKNFKNYLLKLLTTITLYSFWVYSCFLISGEIEKQSFIQQKSLAMLIFVISNLIGVFVITMIEKKKNKKRKININF